MGKMVNLSSETSRRGSGALSSVVVGSVALSSADAKRSDGGSSLTDLARARWVGLAFGVVRGVLAFLAGTGAAAARETSTTSEKDTA